MQNNAVTVIMPVRNGERFLKSSLLQITSFLRLTDEVILIDDGSSDSTARIMYNAAKIDGRFRVMKSGGIGLCGSLNLGISESINTWVARADVDDLYSPRRLMAQTSAIDHETVAIFSDYEMVSLDGRSLGVIPTAINPVAVSLSLSSGQRTPHPSVIFNKYAILEAGGYRDIDFPAEDLSLWLRTSRFGKLKTIPESLLFYRLHSNSVTFMKRHESRLKKDELLRTIGLNSDDIRNAINQIDQTLNSYSNFHLDGERSLLHLGDLYRTRQVSGLSTQKIFSYGLSDRFLRFAVSATKLSSDWLKRRNLRK